MHNKQVSEKQDAIRTDTFVAKQRYDSEKAGLNDYDGVEFDDDIPEIKELRHELKLVMGLISESKFDEIVHLISNPSRFLALNFIIGFVRGMGFFIALLIMAIVIMISLADTSIFSF